MPIDDRSSPTGGPYSSPSEPGSEELHETAERLEQASWDRMQDEAARYGVPAAEDEHAGGAILGFLEQQLEARPLPTLLAAVFAGWLVGKLLR